ncbi:TfoX/Sxy family DNA transformation protein [Tropicibacter sp. R16_0]|uniref:TfoX/Sxy family DNA transformation protein n=1 Tax=Tropicibacter sp. R16_0 TaxID=2821102 RepID=UPI001ADD5DB8|nr:TfoX/Sxy family DNA transformation protein [Tropicibacter sp. R16_0]MBO9449385.1 TfoX/Sxy family DNA transformation protein [Tropicibacter sp. R16_0]
MPMPVSSIRNLGPAFEQSCARAGIHSAEQLRELGPDAAYSKLLAHGTKPHFIGYYVLVMGLQGRPWNDCKGKEKAALRQRFDALKAQVVPDRHHKLVADLDAVGVRIRPEDLTVT